MINANCFDVLSKSAQEIVVPPKGMRLPLWPKLDAIIKGLRVREFSILCGSTGSGKSQFTTCLCHQLFMQGIPQYIMSVENGPVDFGKRLLSISAGFDMNDGDPHPKEAVQEAYKKIAPFVNIGHFSLYDNRVPRQELLDNIDRHVEAGCKLVLMDNINFFLHITKASDQLVEMDNLIHDLVIRSKSLDAHLIMIMHPRKTENGQVSNEFEIKGSSSSVQEAHNVFLFNRPMREEVAKGSMKYTDRILKIAKMRHNGKAVGREILFNCDNGVNYNEAKFAQDYK